MQWSKIDEQTKLTKHWIFNVIYYIYNFSIRWIVIVREAKSGMFVQGIFGEIFSSIGVSSIESPGIGKGSQSHQLNSKSLMLSLTIVKRICGSILWLRGFHRLRAQGSFRALNQSPTSLFQSRTFLLTYSTNINLAIQRNSHKPSFQW